MAPKFSVIVPTHNRADGRLQRALASLDVQRFRDFETVVVDDGSTDSTPAMYWGDCCYIRQEHAGRVVARNTGMQAARGEWVAWLDSDDSWDQMYLATFAWHIERQPDAALWVCGAVVHGMEHQGDVYTVPVWTKLRPAWVPPLDETGRWAHAHFPSGLIGTGMFVFRRACLERTGYMPRWRTHYEVADGVNEWLGYDTGYSAAQRWVGNPWGCDWAMFRRLTQFYQAHSVEACLYVHYVR